jgi:hypothetical protein
MNKTAKDIVIGLVVMTVNPVNIRLSSPQPPNYALPEKTRAILPGQSLTILNTDAFVDQPHLLHTQQCGQK